MTNKSWIEYTIQHSKTLDGESIIALLSDTEIQSYEEAESELKAYLDSNANVLQVEQILTEYKLKFDKKIIEQINWNAEWERAYDSVEVDSFCQIIAPFHTPKNEFQHTITINPGMAFGTGHHATTYMMLKQMQYIDWSGKMVLDYGAGSGVLAFVADKMNAKNGIALEIDDWACNNAEENRIRNNCSQTQVICGTIHNVMDKKFEIILANINKNVLLQSAELLTQVIEKNGIILMSGFYANDDSDLIVAYEKMGFAKIDAIQRNNWSCLKFIKK